MADYSYPKTDEEQARDDEERRLRDFARNYGYLTRYDLKFAQDDKYVCPQCGSFVAASLVEEHQEFHRLLHAMAQTVTYG